MSVGNPDVCTFHEESVDRVDRAQGSRRTFSKESHPCSEGLSSPRVTEHPLETPIPEGLGTVQDRTRVVHDTTPTEHGGEFPTNNLKVLKMYDEEVVSNNF